MPFFTVGSKRSRSKTSRSEISRRSSRKSMAGILSPGTGRGTRNGSPPARDPLAAKRRISVRATPARNPGKGVKVRRLVEDLGPAVAAVDYVITIPAHGRSCCSWHGPDYPAPDSRWQAESRAHRRATAPSARPRTDTKLSKIRPLPFAPDTGACPHPDCVKARHLRSSRPHLRSRCLKPPPRTSRSLRGIVNVPWYVEQFKGDAARFGHVLALDPSNNEASRNLPILLRQHG